MALNAKLAADHLARRDVAIAAARKNENDDAALAAVAEHDAAVRGLVGDAVKSDERAAHVNRLVSMGANQLPDDVAQRSFEDVRILGMRIARTETLSFVERSADALDALDTGNWNAAPAMLAEAPNGSQLLSRVQTFTHNSRRGYVPVVPQISASITGRNDELQPAELATGAIGVFDTVKIAAMMKADHDDLQDYAQLEASLDAALLSALGAEVDDVIVNGGTDGDITVAGLMGLGITTDSAVSVASILSALARVKTARVTPDTILMHPDTEAAFLGAIDGALLGKLPEIVALPCIPADTAIVAALGNTAVAMRENLAVASATDHPDLFPRDQVAFAGRARLGDVVVANAAHVQIVQPAA